MNFSILQHDPSSQEGGGSPGGAQSCLEEVASAEEQRADSAVGDQRKRGKLLGSGGQKKPPRRAGWGYVQPDHVSQGLTWRGPAFMERTLGSGGGLPGGGCFAERFHFHLRFKGFVNKISHL